MKTKRMLRWVIVLFLLAALPVMTAVMAQGEEPASETPVVLEPGAPAAETTTRVSVSSAGVQGNGLSEYPDISDNGQVVAFASLANNLVAGDTNGQWDVFVRVLSTNTTTRVSVNSAGVQGNGRSEAPVLSADGRYVVFGSYANNLVTGDTNGKRDVFIHDRQTGTTTRVSVSSAGAQAAGMSAFYAVSDDGRYVAFQSNAKNLVAGDTNGKIDVFVRDVVGGTTTRVSVSSAGGQANNHSQFPDISGDGRYVAFQSLASNLVGTPTVSWWDVFVHDRQTGTTTLVTIDGGAPDSGAAEPAISANGRYVAVESTSSLPGDPTAAYQDILRHDRQTGQTARVLWASENCFRPAISADGLYTAFSTTDSAVPGDTNSKEDVFAVRGVPEFYEDDPGSVKRVSVSTAGVQANNRSYWAALSADGTRVVFASRATNLVAGDTNGKADIFLRTLEWGDDPEPPQGVKLLALGDSLTYGYQQVNMQYPLGDPNVDDAVTAADITLYTNWLANPGTIPGPTTAAFKRADTDGNGSITTADKNNAQAMVNGTVPRAWFGATVTAKTLASYRLPLYQLFEGQAAVDFTFVGTVDTEKTYNFAGYPTGAAYPQPTPAQIAFVGQWSKTTENVNTGTNPLFSIGPALNAMSNPPDVALVHLGTNDVNQLVTWANSQTALNGILAKLRNGAGGGNPNMKIYVALIIPDAYPGNPCRQNVTFAAICASFDANEVQAFNANLTGWCNPTGAGNTRRCANDPTGPSTTASPVYLVDQTAGFDRENWLIRADEIHTNRRGECAMAQRWYEALRATEYPTLPAAAAGFCNAYPTTP